MLIPLLLLGCKDDPVPAEEILASCGNGIVEEDEQCDDGEANSDTAADACRTSCRLPACGDGVLDSEEACDDGDGWGGDGCDPACAVESGPLESEPNDTWDAAQPLTEGVVHAALTGGDIDCFSLSVTECHTVAASLTGTCDVPVVLALHGPDGTQVAASGLDADGCAVLDPIEEPGARFVGEGDWAICATALTDAEVLAYTLAAESGDSSGYDIPLVTSEDLDGDGLIDDCDGDLDGDGVDNLDDNCPDIPNGDSNPLPTVDSEGFIRHWLTIGPFTGISSPESCLPSETEWFGDDAAAVPVLGDTVEGHTWRVFISDGARVGFLEDYGDVDPPREVYGATWVYSETERSTTLALGPDDGALAWLNGELVLEISGCQGTTADQFTAEVTLNAGWNRLMIKVYDHGGEWGTYARFLGDKGPEVDLSLSLSSQGGWDFDQTDSDGDGVGDVCDED